MHKQAFRRLSRSFIENVAKHYSIAVDKGATFLEMMLKIITTKIGMGQVQAMEILAQRLAHKEQDSCEALMEVDEAMECLERDDVKLVKTAQKQHDVAAVEHQTFQEEYNTNRKEMKDHFKEAQQKQKQGGKHMASGIQKRLFPFLRPQPKSPYHQVVPYGEV